jgi:hypothetical protein
MTKELMAEDGGRTTETSPGKMAAYQPTFAELRRGRHAVTEGEEEKIASQKARVFRYFRHFPIKISGLTRNLRKGGLEDRRDAEKSKACLQTGFCQGTDGATESLTGCERMRLTATSRLGKAARTRRTPKLGKKCKRRTFPDNQNKTSFGFAGREPCNRTVAKLCPTGKPVQKWLCFPKFLSFSRSFFGTRSANHKDNISLEFTVDPGGGTHALHGRRGRPPLQKSCTPGKHALFARNCCESGFAVAR